MGRLLQAQMTLKSDVDVVNYALTLEHLEAAFYKLASQYTFEQDPFGNAINDRPKAIGAHEDAHVTALIKVVGDLGGTPVRAATYDFGVKDSQSFLATAMTLENIGVAARHAACLAVLNATDPFPAALNPVKTKADVLKIAGPFIVGQ